MSTMPTRCCRCGAIIPNGRKYCNPHYQEALAIYEADLQIYERNMAIWESMDDEGRARLDRHAEAETLVGLSGFAGFLSGAFAWYLIAETTGINNLLGLLLVATTTTLSVVIKPLRIIIARFTRIILFTVAMQIISVIIIVILLAIGDFLENEDLTYGLILAAICISPIIAIILEVKGELKSSGKPVEPSKPSP